MSDISLKITNKILNHTEIKIKTGRICIEKDNKNQRYGYCWWTGVHKGIPFYFMRGILGQYVLVVPEKDMIVVRMGRKRDKGRNDPHPDDVFKYLDMGLKLIAK